MKLVFSRNAWADYLEWQLEDGESLKRVNQVVSGKAEGQTLEIAACFITTSEMPRCTIFGLFLICLRCDLRQPRPVLNHDKPGARCHCFAVETVKAHQKII